MARIMLTADWHVREDRPRCRIDGDWLKSQRSTISEIREMFKSADCDQLWILGDIFERPRCGTEYVNMVLDELSRFDEGSVYILAGNHDLPYHNYGNVDRCSLGTLLKVFPQIGEGDHFGLKVSANPFGLDEADPKADVLCTHQLVFRSEEDRPIKELGKTAQELLDENPHARLIFTGDYHHGYIVHKVYNDTLGIVERAVVTPGCINIQKADMADYEPFVVVWDTETDTFSKLYLDAQQDMVTTDYLDKIEERDSRISECIERVSGLDSVDLDFRSALDEALATSSEGVKAIIQEAYENINNNK